MLWRRRTVFAALLLMLATGKAEARFFEQCGDFVEHLEADLGSSLPQSVSTEDGESGLYAAGYLRGAMDTVLVSQFIPENEEKFFCVSERASLEQAARIIIDFARKHPEELQNHPFLCIWVALERAFPCQNQ